MKCIFSINLFDKKISIIMLIFMAFNLFNEYNFKKYKRLIYYNYYYPIFTLIKYLGLIFFSFFLYLFERKNFIVKQNLLKDLNFKTKLNLINFNFSNISNCFFIILISFIDFLDGNFFLYRMKTGGQICQIITFLLFILIYSQNIYKHHFLGLFISFISGLINMFIVIDLYKKNLIQYSNSLIMNILVSLHYLFEKYLIEKKYCSKFLLLFYKGIFGVVFTIISQCIYFFFNKKMLININVISNNKICFIYFFFIIFFIEFFIIIFITKTKNIIFLFIIIFSKFIAILIFGINCKIDVTENYHFFLFFFNSVLNIFGSFIFMELIILNFFKLNENINKEIAKRAIIETKLLNI